MRRHAKARPAGSNLNQARGLGSLIRGAFTTSGLSATAGRGARSLAQRLAPLGLLLAAMLALTAPAALAAETHPYTGISFGPDGVGGTANFANLQSIAVDQASGNVLAYDAGAEKVYKFDSAGTPLNFSGLPGNAIEGVGGGGGNGEYQIAVAPPGSPGGTAGDIYVANNSNSLRIFSPAGLPLGEIAIGEETCGVAVDPTGRVFVGLYPSKVREYLPSASPVSGGDETASSSAELPGICNVAADGISNVYATNYSGGDTFKLEGIGDATPETVDAAPTIAVDPASNDLYANRGDLFAQRSSAGGLIGTSGVGELFGSRGIAVHGASERVYAAGAREGKVKVFGPSVVVPGATSEPATGVTGSKATLRGSVNPAGLAIDSCVFEFGETASYGQSKPCEGAIPTDEADHPVSLPLSGLTPNTTYHFRLVATNVNGVGQSGDRTFTTSQPAVTGTATAVSGSKATLNGTVFPEGEAITECFFQYGTSESFGSTVPCEGATPADEGEHPVTAQLSGLVPNGTHYYFRLVIGRATGVASGGNSTFETAPTVVTEAPTAVAAPNATLNGIVKPEGTPFIACAFEYGVSTAYGQSIPCAESAGEIGSGFASVPVHANLTGLTFGATYHYRLTATNADGIVRGGDESFTTPGAVIEAQWASSVVLSEATLKARINPAGSATTYHFEYGTDTSYGNRTPERNVGADGSGHVVTNPLSGLDPGTTYHYRFVATNAIGVSEGSDRTFTTHVPFVPETDCPNQQFRTGASSRLANCRAYEMVSPVDKNNTDIVSLINIASNPAALNIAATNGDKITYTTSQGFGDTNGVPYVSQYLASRSPGGWANQAITPPQGVSSPVDVGHRIDAEFRDFSADLCSAILLHSTDLPLAPGAVDGELDLYSRDNCGTEGYRWLGTSEDEGIGQISSNGDCTVYNDRQYRLHETCNGERGLVSVLPSGEETSGTTGSSFGAGFRSHTNETAVSSDGSRIYWSGGGGLHLRLNASKGQSAIAGGECAEPAKACTITLPGAGSSNFWGATPDGSRAIFTAADPQTNTRGLYEFDLENDETHQIGRELISSGGSVNGDGVMGVGGEALFVYFVSHAVLSEAAANGEAPSPGGRNLYVHGPDGTQFIGQLSAVDLEGRYLSPTSGEPYQRPARVSADGGQIAFASTAPLTGYDSTDVNSGEEDWEVYIFDATADGGEGSLNCVSCNPTNQRPVGRIVPVEGYETGGTWSAALVPPYGTEVYGSRALTSDGKRVFFDSYDALLPRDTNGKADVYEWEASGSGRCTPASVSYRSGNGGCLSLISSGESPSDSHFVDASADGRDVFFTTASSLLPQDPGLIDIYDAREGGGYPAPPSPIAACEGEACQGPLSPPNDPTPASAAFNGAGNVRKGVKARCGKGKARRKGRCVAKRKKQAKRAQHRANHNRRTAR